MNAENKITYESFTDRVAKRANVTNAEADAYLHELSATVGDALEQGDEVKLYHFGRFSTAHADERPGHNPKTGEALTIPGQTRVDFHPYKALLLAVNWPFQHLRTKMLPEKADGTRHGSMTWLILALVLLALIFAGIYVGNRMFGPDTVAAAPAAVAANVEPTQPAIQETPAVPAEPVTTEPASVTETTAVNTPNTDTATSTPVESAAASTLVVASGDTLWDIAASQWGDPSWWPVIYSENRADLAARNPDLIETGSSLRIPVLVGSTSQPTDADLNQREEAYRVVADDYERLDHSRAVEYREFVNRNIGN